MKLHITVVSGNYSQMVFTLFEDDRVIAVYEIFGNLEWPASWWVASSLGGAKWGDTSEFSILMEKK